MSIIDRINGLLERARSLGRRPLITWQPHETPPPLPADASDEQRELYATLLAMDATVPSSPPDDEM